jgi:hypothetical protein
VPDTAIVGAEVALLATVIVPLGLPATAGAKSTLSVADWPGARTRPELTPLVVNAALVELTPEIVMFEFPLSVRVTLKDLLLPALTLPKLKLVGFAPSTCVAARPVPLRAIAVGEPRAFVLSEMPPETLPEEVGAKTTLNVALLPAEIVCGEKPGMVNPAPVTPPCEIVRLALPAFFSVTVCELPLPTVTLPKLTLDGVTVSCGCVPVALRAIAVGEPGAFVVSEMLPEAPPEEVGANTALNATLLPAEIVCAENPVILNPVPAAPSCEIVRLALPVFFSVIVCEPVLPTATLPKLTLDGVTASCGCVPVALRATVVGEPDAFAVSEMLPETAPGEVGVKTALNVVLLPAEIVCGEKPVILNPAPVAPPCEIVRLALPVFVRVTVCELLLPTATLPKLTLDGVADSCDCAPVALRAIVVGEPGAFVVSEMLPEELPVEVGAKTALNVALLPAAIVCGEKPGIVNPAPVTPPCEIVRLALPTFFSVTVCELLPPTLTLPKLTLDGVTVSCGCVPVPLRAIVSELEASPVNVRVPLAAPAN